jgi:AP endonuclease-1
MTKKLSNVSSDSSLSPPPDNLVSAAETAVNDKKRKADANPRPRRTAVKHAGADEAAPDTEESPQPKRRTAKKVKVTQELSEVEDVQVSLRPKRGAAKKAPLDDESIESEVEAEVAETKTTTKNKKKKQADDEGDEQVVKKTTKSRAPKSAKTQTPFAARTESTDTNLRIGAHVSVAGGKSSQLTKLL